MGMFSRIKDRCIGVLTSCLTGKNKLPHQILFDQLKAGDIAVDCGANVGKMTELMSRHGATVHAFEPNPYAFAQLKKRFGGRKNVVCIPKAVWVKPVMIKLFLHQRSEDDQVFWSTGSSMLGSKGNVDKERFVDVEAVGLAEFLLGLGEGVRLVKIDIEGAECEVIDQLIDLGVHEKIGNILVETHDHKMPELKEATDRIRRRIKEAGINNVHLDWI